jgi:hypothetical protein
MMEMKILFKQAKSLLKAYCSEMNIYKIDV